MKILWIFLGVITKLDYIKGSFLCIFGSFFKVKVQNGVFWGRGIAKISNILKFLLFFFCFFWGGGGGGGLGGLVGMNGRCWAEPTYGEKNRVTPPPPPPPPGLTHGDH